MSRVRCLLALCAAALVAAACAAPRPQAGAAGAIDAARLAGVSADAAMPPVAEHWWLAFGDPQLDGLVDEALMRSPTLAVAEARLAEAQAMARVARAARSPSIGTGASVERQRLSGKGLIPPPYAGSTLNLGEVGVDFSYDVDLFGRVRAAVAAGAAGAAAAAADVAAARLALAAAVSRAYFELDRERADEASFGESLARRREALALADRRRQAGLEPELETLEARSAVAAAEAAIAAAGERRTLVANQLAALLGAGPGRAATLARAAPATVSPPPLPAELPAALVGRRPDVAADRARAAALAAAVRGARADFYPNLNLSAMAGFQSVELGALLGRDTRIWSAGPALTLPIFAGGRLRGVLAGREAEYAAAVQRYNASVIDAFREVADAVASLHALDGERAAATATLAALERGRDLARLRERAGLASTIASLGAEDRVLAQQRALNDLDCRRSTLTVALYRALGGGFGS